MTLLRLTPTGPIWPYSDAMLRADEPGTLFPPVLAAEDRAAFGVIEPQPTEPPAHDPAAERVEESHPLPVGDTWTQAWTVVPLTAEEQAAWQQANRPAADWGAFKTALLSSPDVNAALVAAMTAAPAAALALPAALMAVAEGRPDADFRACWTTLRQTGLISADLAIDVASVAAGCNLPDELVALLGPERARNADGTFRANDPATPGNEAWV